MKDKKGFTLSEILVVIVIIGLILLMAIPSMFGISRSVKKRELESKKDVLVSAAEVYAKNNASKFASIGDFLVIQVPVKTLVYYGYVTPDSNETVCGEDQAIGCIVNPVNNTSMNEEMITIRKNKSIIQASWGTGDTPEPVSSQSGQKTFGVSFNLNGAESLVYTSDDTATRCSGATSCEINTPVIVRTGFDIIGFNTTMTSKTATANSGSKLILNSSNDGKTYYAITKKNVTVTFNANGGTFTSSETSDSCEYHNKEVSCEVSANPNATRTAYSYGTPKWKDSVGTAIDLSAVSSSVTAYLNWIPISYTVTLNLNGGTYSSTPSGYTVSGSNYTKSYNITTSTFTLPNPKRIDYKFLGWTGSNGTTAQKPVSIAKGSYGNKTYTAQWEKCATGYKTDDNDPTKCVPRTYTVTLNPNGGTYSSSSIPSGYTVSGSNYIRNYNITTDTFTLPETGPGKGGHIFSGWTGSNGTTPQKTVSIPQGSYEDKSYTANYNACLAGTYAEAGDESCTPCAAGTYQDQTGQTSCPPCADGYYTDQTGQTSCTPCGPGYTSNSTHTSCVPNTYKLTLNNQNATTAGTTAVWYKYNISTFYSNSGCTTQLSNNKITIPTKTNYKFGGYFTGTNGSGTQYISSDGSFVNEPHKLVSDTTLYAYWYKVTLGGGETESIIASDIDTCRCCHGRRKLTYSATINKITSVGGETIAETSFNITVSKSGAMTSSVDVVDKWICIYEYGKSNECLVSSRYSEQKFGDASNTDSWSVNKTVVLNIPLSVLNTNGIGFKLFNKNDGEYDFENTSYSSAKDKCRFTRPSNDNHSSTACFYNEIQGTQACTKAVENGTIATESKCLPKTWNGKCNNSDMKHCVFDFYSDLNNTYAVKITN
jgi:uncharacterized repeat protein (TIGR02543 family)/prepilin-type N-terminal cleavage/methylation domain-containing protein